MRAAPLLLLIAALAGCGQTGPLYHPDEGVSTPVEVRGPAAAPPAPAEPEDETPPAPPPEA